jgi:hypothetical protein
MTKCDICRGDIPDDEPNLGIDTDDICLWCENIYKASEYDIEKAKDLKG